MQGVEIIAWISYLEKAKKIASTTVLGEGVEKTGGGKGLFVALWWWWSGS